MADETRHSRALDVQILSDPDDLARKESFNVIEQFRAVTEIVENAVRSGRPFRLRPSHLLQLHRTALDGVSAYAGNWRPSDIEIGGSKHRPPPAFEVPERVEELCEYVNDHWSKKSPIHLASYVMWRLNWIHPFTDGNGRTSRALSYVVLCIRLGYLLPGKLTIPEQIEKDKTPYYRALEAADEAWATGNIDLTSMKSLLSSMLAYQLLDTFNQSDDEPTPSHLTSGISIDVLTSGRFGSRQGKRGFAGLPGITGISVTGWKSISNKTEIRLGPLTILAGANSSGKSSLFQPLLMLKQTLEAPYDPGALFLDGSHVKFTEAAQFLSKGIEGHQSSELSIYVSSDSEMMGSTFRKIEGKPIEVIESRFREGTRESGLRLGSTAEEIQYQLTARQKELYNTFVKSGTTSQLSVRRNRCFLEPQLTLNSEDGNNIVIPLPSSSSTDLFRAITSVIHLPGLRGNPERTYPLNATETTYPGPFQNYTASLIQRWKEKKDDQKLIELNTSLRELGLTSQITTKTVDETRVEIRVGRLLEGSVDDDVSIADVGLAISQVLPLLVALVAAERGQLIFVEQPELHLHPKAQVKLARLLARAVRRGARIVLETHSSLLLLGLQTAVAERDIQPNDVQLNWFSRDATGATQVQRADLDEAGAFGDWPEDFADVLIDAENAYLDAAEKVLTKERDARQKTSS